MCWALCITLTYSVQGSQSGLRFTLRSLISQVEHYTLLLTEARNLPLEVCLLALLDLDTTMTTMMMMMMASRITPTSAPTTPPAMAMASAAGDVVTAESE